MNHVSCRLMLTLTALLFPAIGIFDASVADELQRIRLGNEQKPSVVLWLESSLERVFPNTPPVSTNLELLAPRNGVISFQACVRNNSTNPLLVDGQLEEVEGIESQVRLVGLVPMPHFTAGTKPSELEGIDSLPGLVPDPLYPETKTLIGARESRSYWISLKIPADTEPGARMLNFKFLFGNSQQVVNLPVKLEISPFVVQPRHDFPVTHWWRGEATWDYYKTEMFDERWWELTRAQMKNMLEHGSDVVYVPMFFNRRETFKRPCQLLVVNELSPDRYEFDWARVKRFTDMCREIGFQKFEWPHLWIYWGVKNPMRIYTERSPGSYEMLWAPDISGFSDTYVTFLKQFLPEFHDFLVKENLLEDSYFHLSDEPNANHIEDYRTARSILHDLAPWMKTMDALSDISYGKEGVTDIPIPIVSAAQAYIDAKIPHWVYYCCFPTGDWLNRFMDTPLTKIRMSGWLFRKLQAQGFLHWGFNYWHALEQERIIDPFTEGAADTWPSIPYGDPFMIYPGKDGPIDSIRWEVFAESLQDYAILQTAGINPDDKLLDEITSYKDFPRSEEWLNNARRRILQGSDNP